MKKKRETACSPLFPRAAQPTSAQRQQQLPRPTGAPFPRRPSAPPPPSPRPVRPNSRGPAAPQTLVACAPSRRRATLPLFGFQATPPLCRTRAHGAQMSRSTMPLVVGSPSAPSTMPHWCPASSSSTTHDAKKWENRAQPSLLPRPMHPHPLLQPSLPPRDARTRQPAEST
jgi:hypothetical protein